MPSHHRCCNPVVLFSNHSFQFAVLRYLHSFGCRCFSLKTNGSLPTRSPWRKNSGWGFLRRLLATPSTHLPFQLPQFRHSAQKHIVACNGIVIRLHPPRHFTSAVASYFRREKLPLCCRELALSCRELALSCRELALSCREFVWFCVCWRCVAVSSLSFAVNCGCLCEFAWSYCNFCFCRDTYGPPHPFAVSFSFAARLFLLPWQLWATVELSVI